jgi:gluconolactonase
VLNHRAEPVQVLHGTPGNSLTNLAFGGVGHKTLYCTDSSSGSILSIDMDMSGAKVRMLG